MKNIIALGVLGILFSGCGISSEENKTAGEQTKISQERNRVSDNMLESGGPPKDGIPALENPKFEKISQTVFSENELIIGVEINGEAKAYPYGILNWHEIVNDTISGVPIAVTLCPLCDTTPVFIRKINGVETTFGVSGQIFQSCLVMYDRGSDSLWSQPWGIGIQGALSNYHLEKIPASRTTVGAWKKKFPNSLILSSDTGYTRDYFRYPYGKYRENKDIFFSVRNKNLHSEDHPKEPISYISSANADTPQNTFSGEYFSITHAEIQDQKTIDFIFNTKKSVATWNEELQSVEFFVDGEIFPSSTGFGFIRGGFFFNKKSSLHAEEL